MERWAAQSGDMRDVRRDVRGAGPYPNGCGLVLGCSQVVPVLGGLQNEQSAVRQRHRSYGKGFPGAGQGAGPVPQGSLLGMPTLLPSCLCAHVPCLHMRIISLSKMLDFCLILNYHNS